MQPDSPPPQPPFSPKRPEDARKPSFVTGEYWRWCLRCGHELQNDRCKLVCPRCHYFLSCSDFD